MGVNLVLSVLTDVNIFDSLCIGPASQATDSCLSQIKAKHARTKRDSSLEESKRYF